MLGPVMGGTGGWAGDEGGPRGALMTSVMEHLARGATAVSQIARDTTGGFFADAVHPDGRPALGRLSLEPHYSVLGPQGSPPPRPVPSPGKPIDP